MVRIEMSLAVFTGRASNEHPVRVQWDGRIEGFRAGAYVPAAPPMSIPCRCSAVVNGTRRRCSHPSRQSASAVAPVKLASAIGVLSSPGRMRSSAALTPGAPAHIATGTRLMEHGRSMKSGVVAPTAAPTRRLRSSGDAAEAAEEADGTAVDSSSVHCSSSLFRSVSVGWLAMRRRSVVSGSFPTADRGVVANPRESESKQPARLVDARRIARRECSIFWANGTRGPLN